jgi:hypothetical protein
VRTAAFFVARNGPCSRRRKKLKLAIPEPFSLFHLPSASSQDLIFLNTTIFQFCSVLLGVQKNRPKGARRSQMKNQVNKLLVINKVQRRLQRLASKGEPAPLQRGEILLSSFSFIPKD